MSNFHGYSTRLLLIGLVIRLSLAPFFVQSYDFVHVYYSALDVMKGVNPYDLYEFPYPPLMLYVFSMLATIYFKSGLFLENLDWPSALDWPHTLFKAGLVSVTLVGFDVPPPLFNFVFKLPMIVADIAIAVLLYKICYLNPGNMHHAGKAMSLWCLNPLVIWMSSVHGAFDSVAVFFALLAFYLLVKKSYALGALSLSLGTLTKLYPIFLVPLALSWSIKAKRARLFTICFVSSLLVYLTPALVVNWESLYHGLLGQRSTAVFLGGLNFWAIKYLYPPMDLFIISNATAIFLLLSSLLFLSLFLICIRDRNRFNEEDISHLNYLVLSTIVAVYVFSPIIIQPQYMLLALPFLILNVVSLHQEQSSPQILRIETVVSNIRVKILHKFSYLAYLRLFWLSALIFEVFLQSVSVVTPIVLKTAVGTDVIPMILIYSVRDLVYLRSFIFFSAALLCTLSYAIPLTNTGKQKMLVDNAVSPAKRPQGASSLHRESSRWKE